MPRTAIVWLTLAATALAANTSILNAFNSGELSPLLDGRTDVEKYYSGAKVMENMVVMSQGGATRRPGTKFIAQVYDGGLDPCYPTLRTLSDAEIPDKPDQQVADGTPSFTEVSDLAGLRAMAAGSNYYLSGDLDCSATLVTPFDPIAGFDGVFDGNGFSLQNLNIAAIDDGGVYHAGLFSSLQTAAQVWDVTFEDCNITDDNAQYAGFVAGSIGGVTGSVGDILIRDVTVTGGTITISCDEPNPDPLIGGLVGMIMNASTTEWECDIFDCNVDCDITFTNTAESGHVGGVIGWISLGNSATDCEMRVVDCNSSGTIEATCYGVGGVVSQVGLTYRYHDSNDIVFHTCTSDVDITGYGANFGGFAASADDGGEYVSCTASGDIEAQDIEDNYLYIGGFCGYAYTGDFIDCSASGALTGVTPDGGTPPLMGGFVGETNGTTYLVDPDRYTILLGCNSTSDITVDDADNGAGGFVGKIVNYTDIDKCYSYGSITIDDSADCDGGGFGYYIGGSYTKIDNCYSWTDISADTGTGYATFGGFISWGYAGTWTSSNVTNCYAKGTVPDSEWEGYANGFIGPVKSDATVSSCYWDTETSGQATSYKGTGKTTEEMYSQDTYSGWDFTDIWYIPVLVSEPCRLLPFEYSTEDTYIIEAGDEYMRFFRNGALILDSNSDPYVISTCYDQYELDSIQYVQSADTMYIVDGNDAPRKLTRTAHAAWTLTAIDFSDGPFLDENTGDTTITPSATTGSITLTGSADIWDANHVGALWEITHIVDSNTVAASLRVDGNSDPVTVYKGQTVDFTTHGNWHGTVYLQRSYDDGSTWRDVCMRNSARDSNVSYTDEEPVDDALYRVRYDETPLDSRVNSTVNSKMTYNLTALSYEINGVVEITAYSSATSMTGTVQRTLGSTDATVYWAEGAWSDDEGWPRAVSFYEERCVYAGTTGSPQTLWFSVVDDWDNFLAGDNDADALIYTLAGNKVSAVQWLCPHIALLAGTASGEWKIWSGSADEPMTPTKVQCREQTTFGSEAVQAFNVENVALFVQRGGRKVRELAYSFELDSYVAPDMTALAEHVTYGGISGLAYQKNPDPIVWCVRDDGTLCGLTYNREHNVVGWHRHELGGSGLVQSAAVIPGASGEEDEVWVAVTRTIDSEDVCYIERFEPRDFGDDVNDVYFVDCGLSYDGESATDFSGLDHLIGETIAVVADGNYTGTEVVDANGEFSLDDAASKVSAGYAYTSKLQTMRLEAQTKAGSGQGRTKRIINVTCRFWRTADTVEGAANWTDTPDTFDPGWDGLYDGDQFLLWPGGYETDAYMCLQQQYPLPMTILALIPEFEVN